MPISTTIDYLFGIKQEKMAILVVILTTFGCWPLKYSHKQPKFDHLCSDFAKMHKVNPFSIHFYYSNLPLTQFSKFFIAFLLVHCVTCHFEQSTYSNEELLNFPTVFSVIEWAWMAEWVFLILWKGQCLWTNWTKGTILLPASLQIWA